MDKQTLEEVAAWAKTRVDSGKEPPWTYHNLVTLADIAKELSAGIEAATQTGSESVLEAYQSTDREQGAGIVRLDTFRSQPDVKNRVKLPT